MRILDRSDGNIGLGVLSFLTLTVIPCTGTDEFNIKTTLNDSQGNTLGSFEKTETINTWIQLLLIFFTPFNGSNSISQTLYDLNCATINEANEKAFY